MPAMATSRCAPDIDRFDGKTVHFKDGTIADYDMIVAATGYQLHYPFIDRELLNWQGDAPHLYLNCMHPERDDLFVLGMVEASGLGWQGRHEQAEMVARYIAGLQAGSPAAEAIRKEKAAGFERVTGGMNYLKLARMAYYVDKDDLPQGGHRQDPGARGGRPMKDIDSIMLNFSPGIAAAAQRDPRDRHVLRSRSI